MKGLLQVIRQILRSGLRWHPMLLLAACCCMAAAAAAAAAAACSLLLLHACKAAAAAAAAVAVLETLRLVVGPVHLNRPFPEAGSQPATYVLQMLCCSCRERAVEHNDAV